MNIPTLEFQKLAKIELAKRYVRDDDILGWGKLLFPGKFKLPFCKELHNYFVDIRDEEITSTLAPRSHAKTTIKCFLIPIYMALNHPDKYRYYLNVQSKTSKAIAVNLAIREEIENNELMHDIYGGLKSKKWTEKIFELENGVVFGGIGAGESMRGINYNNLRPDYIIIDDLYDDDDKYNPQRISKKNNWFWSSLYPARAQTKHSCIHIQGTAIANNDLMHTLANSCKYRKFKAIKSDKTKEVLWQEFKSYDDLMLDKQRMGSNIFANEFQNEIRDDETSLIKQRWIKFYEHIDTTKEIIIGKYLGIDPSIGATNTSDYTGMAVIYHTIVKNTYDSDRFYILDIVNERLTMQERIQTAVALYSQYNFSSVLVEGIAGFKDFVAELKRVTNLPVKEINFVKNKIARLDSVSPKFENSKIFINKNIEITKQQTLIDQIINNTPEHDDIRDAIFLCILNNDNKTIDIDKMKQISINIPKLKSSNLDF